MELACLLMSNIVLHISPCGSFSAPDFSWLLILYKVTSQSLNRCQTQRGSSHTSHTSSAPVTLAPHASPCGPNLLSLCSCPLVVMASLVAQLVKNPRAMRETWVQSLGWEDLLEKGKATHSSILAWRIQSTRSQRVGHN